MNTRGNIPARKQKNVFRIFLLVVFVFLLSTALGSGSALSQEPADDSDTQTAPGANLDETNLPLLFEDDFEYSALDPDVWAYDIRHLELLFEDLEETNLVGQVGHEEMWAEVTLLEGSQWRNYIVDLDVKLLAYVDGADNFFLSVRHDPEEGEYSASLDLARRMVTLSSTLEGIWQGVSVQAPLVLDLNTWYHMRVYVEDDNLAFFVNNELITEITETGLDKGTIRLLAAPGSLAQVDNITIREIPSFAEEDDLLITEFMFRDEGPQWFEVYNTSGRHLKLTDLKITNGREIAEVSTDPFLIAPDSFAIFASEEVNFELPPDVKFYNYGTSVKFPEDNGYFALRTDDVVVTQIEYSEATGWPLQDNVSVAVHKDYMTRRRQNNGTNWCPSVQRLDAGPIMRGSPGLPNHICYRELPLTEYTEKQTGTLIFSEVMAKLEGADEGREWIEVYNTTDEPISMTGLTLATDKPTERHTITDSFVVQPKSYGVLAQTGLLQNDLPPELPVYYYPGNFKISNDGGELLLLDGDKVLDRLSYRVPLEGSWWPVRGNESMTLHPDAMSAYSNDDALNWCLGWSRLPNKPEIWATPGAPNDPCPMWEINSPLVENQRAYELTTFEPIEINLTISQDVLNSMNTNPFSDTLYPMAFSGPDYPNPGNVVNGSMRPRGGRGTRAAAMLSYRIRLDGEPFRGNRTIQINKHLGDSSRLRNQLAFRLMAGVNDMVSLQTQFVRLFINGEDQGLYTMIESPSRTFLRGHRLDDRGHLFKIQLPSGTSSFFYYADTDRAGRIDSIQLTAQVEAGVGHEGLIDAIDSVYSDMDVNTVIDRHFNKANLLTYYSMVYLLQNRDTRVQNYMIYTTPREPDRIYYVPWDWDISFRVRNESMVFVGRWREGFGNWTGIGIFDRILRDPALVDELLFKMLELVETSLSPERVSLITDQLVAEVQPFTRRAPEHLELSPEAIAEDAEEIKQVIGESARMVSEWIEWPLPPRTDGVEYNLEEHSVKFNWNESYDLQGDPVTYEVVLFNERLWNEENIIWRTERTSHTSLTLTEADIPDEVPAGTYYWMVYVYDDKNNYNTSGLGSLGDIEMIVDLP